MPDFSNFYVSDFLGAFVNIRRPMKLITEKRNFCVLSYRLSGGTVFYRNGREFHACAGDVVYIPESTEYTQENKLAEELIAVHFRASSPLPDEIAVFRFGGNEYMRRLFTDILSAYESRRGHGIAQCLSGFYSAVALIGSESSAERLPPVLYRASEIMRRDYTDSSLTVAAVAQKAGISGTHLRNLCSQHFGCTPHVYLARLRLDRAGDMLKSGYYSSAQVAGMCGYDNPKSFYTAFRRYYACTPGEYRRSQYAVL